jgi:hypothetical protein
MSSSKSPEAADDDPLLLSERGVLRKDAELNGGTLGTATGTS